MNIYERSARGEKVSKLVGVIDRMLIQSGVSPHGATAHVNRFDANAWRHASVIAGVRLPSFETISQVISVYRKREEPPPAEQWGF